MPGISIVYGTELKEESFDALKYEEHILVKKILTTKSFSLIFSGFEGYPYFRYFTKTFSIFLEGIIYNLSSKDLKEALSQIAQIYLEKGNYKEIIKKFVLKSCGDFIGLIYFPNKEEFLLFNDQWGRLPCFYFKDSDKIMISREIKFILHYIPKIRYNRIALIEYLTVRYPLGNKTIFENIRRLIPGHLISYNKDEFTCTEIVGLNFEKLPQKSLSKKYFVEKGKNLLFSSTKDRLDKLKEFKIVIDLSGGYDTRAVFSAAFQVDKMIIPISIKLITGDESEVATQVAKVYGVDILRIQPKHDLSYPVVQDILYITDGFLYGYAAASGYQNRKHLRNQFKEPIANFMGFGGEFLRHPKKFKPFHKTMLDVIIIDSFPLYISQTIIKSSCRCLGVEEKEIFDFWTKFYNSTYKESRMEDKVAHYYFDYYNLYVGQGEDRARIYVWTVNPMMSSEWLKLATKEIPWNFCDYNFFEQLLSTIDPNIAVSKIPIWGSVFKRTRIYKFITSHKFSINLGKKYLRRKWKKMVKNDSQRKLMIEKILELYDTTESIQTYFHKDGVVNFCETEYGPNYWFLWKLLSLFLYINTVETRHSLK